MDSTFCASAFAPPTPLVAAIQLPVGGFDEPLVFLTPVIGVVAHVDDEGYCSYHYIYAGIGQLHETEPFDNSDVRCAGGDVLGVYSGFADAKAAVEFLGFQVFRGLVR